MIESSNKFSKDTEEKIIQKMEISLKNREEHLSNLMERLKEHVSDQNNASQHNRTRTGSGVFQFNLVSSDYFHSALTGT